MYSRLDSSQRPGHKAPCNAVSAEIYCPVSISLKSKER
jgi:hypothetical protein